MTTTAAKRSELWKKITDGLVAIVTRDGATYRPRRAQAGGTGP